MNNFLEEKEKLLNSIENNTSEHWKKYYKNVPINCIFDDLVIDINEIKRLTEENQELKADYGTKAQVERDLLMEENQKYKEVINKAIEYIEQHAITVTDGNITTNKHELLEILKEVE